MGLRLPDAGRWRRDPPHPRTRGREGSTTSSSSRTTTAWRETWTAADGRSFTLTRATGSSRTSRLNRLAARCIGFEFHENGEPFVITDSSGKVISRDRGNIAGSYTFDFGTGEFNFLGFELHGPHPMFGVDLCKAVEPLTGISDSARYLTERPIGSTDSPAGCDEYLPPSYTGDRAAESAPHLLPRLRRNGRRHARGDLEARPGGNPEVHQRRRLADRSTVRRACPAARRGSTWLRLLVVRRRPVRRLVQHAGAT